MDVISISLQIRLYPRGEKLDNSFAKIFKVQAQVLLLNLLQDDLVVFCADNQIDIYNLELDSSGKGLDLCLIS